MKKPKHLVHFISSLNYGGAERVLCILIKHLALEDYQQSVIFIHAGPHLSSLQEMGIKCYQIKGILRPYDPVFFWRLFSLIKRLKPDLMHTSLWAANFCGRIMAKMLKIPIVHAYHNQAELDGQLRNCLDLYTGARHIPAIAASDLAARSLKVKGIAANRIKVIYNGVFLPAFIEKSRNECFIIGMVARAIPAKNHKLLIKALAILKQQGRIFKAVFIGDAALAQLKNDLYDNDLIGVVECIIGCDSSPYFQAMDCLILPSLCEGGISLAVQEAMANQIPCIISHQANLANLIVDRQNGLLCSGFDEIELADCIAQYMDNEAFRHCLSQAGRRTIIDRCSVDQMIANYSDYFAQFFN